MEFFRSGEIYPCQNLSFIDLVALKKIIMPYKYFIIAAGIFGLIQYFRNDDQFVRLILGGQLIAITLTLIPIHNFASAGFLLFALTVFMTIIYALTKHPIIKGKKLLIILMAVPILFINIYTIQRLPNAGILGLIMIIPVLAYLIVLVTNLKKYKSEIGFLTILAVDAGIRLAMAIEIFLNAQ